MGGFGVVSSAVDCCGEGPVECMHGMHTHHPPSLRNPQSAWLVVCGVTMAWRGMARPRYSWCIRDWIGCHAAPRGRAQPGSKRCSAGSGKFVSPWTGRKQPASNILVGRPLLQVQCVPYQANKQTPRSARLLACCLPIAWQACARHGLMQTVPVAPDISKLDETVRSQGEPADSRGREGCTAWHGMAAWDGRACMPRQRQQRGRRLASYPPPIHHP